MITTVHAGAGDDTICVDTPGSYDGGSGVDSIELVDGYTDGAGATVIDFEQLDVRTIYELGINIFEWTEVPSELSGSVDASYLPEARSAKYFDNPTVRLVVPDSSAFGLRVDQRTGEVSLGGNLGFALRGVDDFSLNAHRIRVLGNAGSSHFIMGGCDVVARGGGSVDRLEGGNRKGDPKSCPGVRFYGQAGKDKLVGGRDNDVLIGGPGRDRAFGGKGRDRCVAEREYDCEL